MLTKYPKPYLRYETEVPKKIETATTDIFSSEEIERKISKILERAIEELGDIIALRGIIEKIVNTTIEFEPFECTYSELEPLDWIKIVEKEYPEAIELSKKLKSNKELTKIDEWNLNEITEASGWDKEDVIEDLKNLDVNPSKRVEIYKSLFKKYYNEAKELERRGDTVQAAEKLWGAITALIKAYAAKKGILVEHWSKSKLNRVVENNVEEHLREKFEDLLTYGNELHEHFYEKRLPPKRFERRWNQCVKLIEDVFSCNCRHF